MLRFGSLSSGKCVRVVGLEDSARDSFAQNCLSLEELLDYNNEVGIVGLYDMSSDTWSVWLVNLLKTNGKLLNFKAANLELYIEAPTKHVADCPGYLAESEKRQGRHPKHTCERGVRADASGAV
eukprot:862693-Karenia_brevis.AAC.1